MGTACMTQKKGNLIRLCTFDDDYEDLVRCYLSEYVPDYTDSMTEDDWEAIFKYNGLWTDKFIILNGVLYQLDIVSEVCLETGSADVTKSDNGFIKFDCTFDDYLSFKESMEDVMGDFN